MLAYYYQGKQPGLDQSQPWGLRGLDQSQPWGLRGLDQSQPRRGFTTTERALRVSVSACLRKRTTINWALGVKSVRSVCVWAVRGVRREECVLYSPPCLVC